MRKNINKLVAVAIGVSVMSGSIMPVFAANTTTQNTSTITSVQAQTIGKQVLTLDDAIKAAVSNSETLALTQKEISYTDKINDINEKIDDSSQTSEDDKDFNKDKREIQLKKLKQQQDFDQDKLIQQITTDYNKIVTSQKEIDKAKRELEIKTKELNDTKLKKNLGLETSIGLQGKELAIEQLENVQKLSENKLKDAQYSFKILTSKDVTQYNLEQDIKYEAFRIDGSVDENLDNVIENYKTYNTQLVKLNKDYYSDNEVPAIDEISDNKPEQKEGESDEDYATRVTKYQQTETTNYMTSLSNRITYFSSKLGNYTNETTLNEDKKRLKNSLKSVYTDLLAKEDSINLLKKNIELNNKQLSNAKLRSDLGMITKSDYNTQVVSSEDLELQLRSAIDTYNTLKEQIQKPWIAFS